MSLLKFTAPDGTVVGLDHTEVRAVHAQPGKGTTLIDRPAAGGQSNYVIVTESPMNVIDRVREVTLALHQQQRDAAAADRDLVEKRIRLAELQLATARLMPPPKDKP